MIIVTGGAGFIGSNIVKGLNQQGITDILVVDNLKNGHKFRNIVDLDIHDYQDKDDFLADLLAGAYSPSSITAIFHEGACSATTEWDGKFMMQNNYEYSKALLHFAIDHKIPFIYASSAATYGNNETFIEGREHELPINVYGYSKFLFDEYVRQMLPHIDSQVVGLKYFNVYGPREQHKGSMASVAFHHYNQFKANKTVKLFGEYNGYGAGEQVRDFIYVEDVVAVNLWFLENGLVSGIFNCGTGRAQPFNDIAKTLIGYFNEGQIEYIDFPDHLRGHYQCFTQADLTQLRSVGCDIAFKDVQQGVTEYLKWLEKYHHSS